MTLYEGQKMDNDRITFTNEQSKLSFDEVTRKLANEAIKTGQVSAELVGNLIEMSHNGSHQASYFLGKFVMEELITFPNSEVNEVNVRSRGNAGPGFVGELKLGPYAKGNVIEVPYDVPGFHGDPYEDYEQ